MKDALKNQSVSPETAFRDSIKATLSQHNKRARPMSAELLDEASYKRVHQIFRDRFSDPASFTFFFVGNIDMEKAKPLIEKYLGSLSADTREETWKDLGITYPKGKVDVTAYKGSEPKSTVLMQFNHDFDYNQKDRLALKALGKILSIDLIDEIREKNSWVYSIGAYPNYEKLPTAKAVVTVYFPTSPEHIEDASKGVLEIFKKVSNDGPTEVNLNKAKQQLLKERETHMRENTYWINAMKAYDFNQIDYSEFKKEEAIIKSLTKEDIIATAKKYLNLDNYIRVYLVPEK
jgi:zinc protease